MREVRAGFAELRAANRELAADVAEFRNEVRDRFDTLIDAVAGLRQDLERHIEDGH